MLRRDDPDYDGWRSLYKHGLLTSVNVKLSPEHKDLLKELQSDLSEGKKFGEGRLRQDEVIALAIDTLNFVLHASTEQDRKRAVMLLFTRQHKKVKFRVRIKARSRTVGEPDARTRD